MHGRKNIKLIILVFLNHSRAIYPSCPIDHFSPFCTQWHSARLTAFEAKLRRRLPTESKFQVSFGLRMKPHRHLHMTETSCVRLCENETLPVPCYHHETSLTPRSQGETPRVIYFRVNSNLPLHLKVTVNVCLGLKVNLPHEALCTAKDTTFLIQGSRCILLEKWRRFYAFRTQNLALI